MPQTHDDGDEGSRTEGDTEAEGLDTHPHTIDLLLEGFEYPGGHADLFQCEIIRRMFIKDKTVNWRRFQFEKLYITQPAHLFLLQGMVPAQFFLSASLRCESQFEQERFFKGPMLFIYGKLSEPWETPAFFSDLVLGQILKSPESQHISLLEVMAGMHTHEAKRRKS